ncbi:hypothetical protein MLD38_035712 [Melastoma candidum]|uniref:Uncharacterized protein n=1 Tax=Melastoma candidum TaxID=119954 RepID=A0ACB9LHN6_9MYRT|nr:hypothetical protein MLD38_035712 [Melastoma candidum]
MSGIPTDGPAHRGGGRDHWEHDVFVSFRGTDTRAGFVSHLHHAFRVASVAAFTDYQLQRGEIISPSLRKAIETSRMAVVVFSPNYASSSWCLAELVAIMECREKRGQLVRPVFLYIEPGEVRHQTGIFGDAMRVHEEDRKEDPAKVRRWRDALTQTANLAGWNLGDGLESELVQRIVEEVSSKLRRPYFDVAKHPVGLDPHVETVMSRIRMGDMPEDAHLLGICGVGGIGKTTVAKAVYNRIADEYDGSSFLANVREVARQHGVVKLQESLLHDILGDSKLKVGYIQTGVSMMRDKLDGKRVLLVLDDVDRSNQVNDLLGKRNWLGLGSRIIITSTSAEVLADVGVADVYKINQLNHDDSLELFSWNAFKKPHPTPDYKFLSSFFVTHAMGLPLSLIILGSFLRSKSVVEWKQASDRLKASVSGNMDLIIQFCFQGLEAHERAIFLDIACFFNGEDKNYVIKLLDRCNFYPDSGLEILVQKSLIRIELNKIWMHDLLQEAGREIVRQESPANPGRRSRLWHPEDVLRVLQENSGTNLVEGIKLDMVEPEMVCMSSRAIGQMKRLRLVMIRDVHISGCPEYLSNDLRWLDVHGNESSGPSEIPCLGVVTIPNTTLDTVEYSGILENQRRTAWACQCPISVKILLGKRLNVFSAFKRVSIECDVEVHAANKLASKHQRLLLHPNPSSLPICDICQRKVVEVGFRFWMRALMGFKVQITGFKVMDKVSGLITGEVADFESCVMYEKPAFIFCVEERALFCKDCDEPIHSGNSLATDHRRFLATGIKVAQGSNPAPTAEKEDEPPSRSSPPQTSTRWSQQQQPLPQQQLSSFSSPWGADDLLQLPDFGYTEKEQLEFGLGELDWFDDMSLFPHEEVSSGGAAAEVPQRPISPPAIGISSRMSKPSMPLKKQRTGFVPDMPYKKQKTAFLQDVDEFFTVPDLG